MLYHHDSAARCIRRIISGVGGQSVESNSARVDRLDKRSFAREHLEPHTIVHLDDYGVVRLDDDSKLTVADVSKALFLE